MSIFKDIKAIIAMLIIAAVLIVCIANNINHGIIYTSLVAISGLGGYFIKSIVSKK